MIALCSLGMGLFVDWVYLVSGVQANVSVGQASQIIPYNIRLGAALVLTALMAYNGISNIRQTAGHAHSH